VIFAQQAVAEKKQTFKINDLVLSKTWVKASPRNARAGAGYLSIENLGSTDDSLIKVSSPIAGMSMIHDTVIEDGVAKMKHLDRFVIPAGKLAELKPGGLHIMLMGLKTQLNAGSKVTLTLKFLRAGSITVDFPIMKKRVD
tara:strand:- start:603 stop:1025 length:423 start_codon:yes stop_codon:yes gene_type:complete